MKHLALRRADSCAPIFDAQLCLRPVSVCWRGVAAQAEPTALAVMLPQAELAARVACWGLVVLEPLEGWAASAGA